MRIIIHIGPMKTGTTALQESLAAHRRGLLARGVLYPRGNDPANQTNHHLLAMAVLDEDTWRGRLWWGHRQDPETVRDRAASYWASVRREIDQHRPDTVVLSSELFSWARSPREYERLRLLASEISDDLVPCLYMRDPADRWLSHFQQSARHSTEPRTVNAARFRPQLEAIEAAFGLRPVVRAYDRKQLIGGDIVRDFTTAILGASAWQASIASRSANEALSPEALSIVFDFRRINYVGRKGQGSVSTGRLITDLQTVEARMPRGQRLVLRPDVRAELTRATLDLPWLRSEYGIAFPGIDYDQPFDANALVERPVERVEDVVEVDEERKRELLSRLLLHYATDTNWTRCGARCCHQDHAGHTAERLRRQRERLRPCLGAPQPTPPHGETLRIDPRSGDDNSSPRRDRVTGRQPADDPGRHTTAESGDEEQPAGSRRARPPARCPTRRVGRLHVGSQADGDALTTQAAFDVGVPTLPPVLGPPSPRQ